MKRTSRRARRLATAAAWSVYGAGTETVMVVVLTMVPLVAVMVTVPVSGGGGKIWKVVGAVTVCWGT